MSDQKEIQQLIKHHRRRLQQLKELKARLGINTPPEVLTEIEDIEAEIKNLQAQLKGLRIDRGDISSAVLSATSRLLNWQLVGGLGCGLLLLLIIGAGSVGAISLFGLWWYRTGEPTPIARMNTPLPSLTLLSAVTLSPTNEPSPTFILTKIDTATATPLSTIANIPVLTDTPTPTFQCTVTVGALNLREGPGEQFSIISRMTSGIIFEGVGRTADGTWIFGISPRASGWASASFLACPFNVYDLPMTPSPPPPNTENVPVVAPSPTFTSLPSTTSAPPSQPTTVTSLPSPTSSAPSPPPTNTSIPLPNTPLPTNTSIPTFTPTPTPTITPMPTPTNTPTNPPQSNDCIGWEFETDGDTEGWRRGSGLDDTTASQGSLVAHISGGDPYWWGPEVSIDTSVLTELQIKYRIEAFAGSWMQMLWYIEGEFESGQWIDWEIEMDNAWHEETVDLSSKFTWQGTVTQLRLDPVRQPATSGQVVIDYIRICPPS